MSTVVNKLTLMASVAIAILSLSACQPESTATSSPAANKTAAKADVFHGSDVSDEGIGGDFSLTNQDGKTMGLADFKGKIVVLSFGYTRCPDVCPTTLLDLAQTVQLLGNDASKMQVVFISLDPSRDTPSVLKDYVPLFNDGFIGLTAADDAAMAPVLKQWKIAATKVPISDGHYSIDHSAGLYILDTDGKAKLYLPYGSKPEAIAADVRALLK